VRRSAALRRRVELAGLDAFEERAPLDGGDVELPLLGAIEERKRLVGPEVELARLHATDERFPL